ncbi:uncharacterized protein LOC113794902 [Dermatophagoides pteronyssinus]|uniref:uncharacterized protein LOC113794902 n=1 Tax=Dermatophagoides pteronyssinus TaxID=6956 RepID=UPI003F67204F
MDNKLAHRLYIATVLFCLCLISVESETENVCFFCPTTTFSIHFHFDHSSVSINVFAPEKMQVNLSMFIIVIIIGMTCDSILSQNSHYQYAKQQQQLKTNRFYSNSNNNIVQAAIVRKHRIIYVNSPSMDTSRPVTIQVPAQSIPLTLILRSSSTDLNVIPQHLGSHGGSHSETESIDEPHRLIHVVRKPIIQEIYEVIEPYRYVKQEIQPVQETIRTVIARQVNNNDPQISNNQMQSYANHNQHYGQQQAAITMIPYQQQESQQQQQQLLWQIQMRNQLIQQYRRAIYNGLLTNLYGIPVL